MLIDVVMVSSGVYTWAVGVGAQEVADALHTHQDFEESDWWAMFFEGVEVEELSPFEEAFLDDPNFMEGEKFRVLEKLFGEQAYREPMVADFVDLYERQKARMEMGDTAGASRLFQIEGALLRAGYRFTTREIMELPLPVIERILRKDSE